LPLIEKRFPVEILDFMARPPGSKNKRTLLMEQRMRERAAGTEVVQFDSLKIMEDCMNYFYRRFVQIKAKAKSIDDEKAQNAARDAFSIAEKMAPYQHPRMTTMKIAHDPNADRALDGLSKKELRQQFERDLEELGLFLTTERPANTNRGNGSVS
jgi:hypothetical protein